MRIAEDLDMMKLLSKIENHKILFLLINLILAIVLFFLGFLLWSKKIDYINMFTGLALVIIVGIIAYFFGKFWIEISKNWIIYELSPYFAKKLTPIIFVVNIILLALVPFFSEVYLVFILLVPWFLLLNIEMKNVE
jgi:hypothetical protein